MADPVNLDPINVPDPVVLPQPAAPTVVQPPVVPPPVLQSRRSSWLMNVAIALLAFAILVLAVVLVVVFKRTSTATTETSATTTVEKTKIEETKKFKAEAEKLKSEAEKLKTELEMAKALKPLRDEVQKLTEKRQAEVGMTAMEALISGQSRLGPEAGSRPVRKPAPASLLPPEPVFVEEKDESRVHEEELVRHMFNMNTPVADRAKATEELGGYKYFRVARALSFILQRDKIPKLRAAAASSMGEVANSSFLPMLKNSAEKDPDPNVKAAAKTAVEKISARVEADQDF